MKKKILMICYYYPPLADVGCKRSIAFAKYLKKQAWQPHVLSVKNPDRTYCQMGSEAPQVEVPTFYTYSLFSLYWFFGKINGLASRILSLVNIRLQRNYLHDVFSIPDLFCGWIPGAVFSGVRLIKKYDLDCIYVSCTPYSSAIAGVVIKKITNKPLVVDFRDPFYVTVPNISIIPKFRRKINKWIEKRIIDNCDKFVVNTKEVENGYLKVYPEIKKKITTIHNGFDHVLMPEEFQNKYKKFTIIYAGNMYLEVISATPFFEALSFLKKENQITSESFQFLYFGGCHERVLNLSREHETEDIVHISTSIPYTELLQILKQSHLQLLRILKPMISTKLFEGIALDIPFLATIPEGEVADIITAFCPSSYLVHDDSAQMISNKILEAMQDYKEGDIKPNDVERFLTEFSREKMTYKLEAVFSEIIQE
jgi:glycosyltransferase involved in cell wall biosynthesis